ncbi:spermidine synthase, partial [Bacillus sp. SIMBA_074]
STLYTTEFFQRLAAQLSDDGVMVCQSFSPEDAPTVYWSIELSLKAAGLHTQSYHCLVPSFGDWGFHLAAPKPLIRKTDSIPVP